MDPDAVVVDLPFDGAWRVENSPARRVPSRGPHLLGSTYAIDFVGVDDRGRTAPSAGWRALLSVRVAVGQRVVAGEQLATCGNSGSSTQPHVHLQVVDGADLDVARGLPVRFRAYRERVRGERAAVLRHDAVPAEGAVVERVGPARCRLVRPGRWRPRRSVAPATRPRARRAGAVPR